MKTLAEAGDRPCEPGKGPALKSPALEGEYTVLVPTNDRGYWRVGMLVLLLGLGGFGGWAFTANLAVAVVAPGHVAVETFRRTVQHLEGGIVREILVADGDRIEAGQPLVVIDDTRARTQLRVARTQYLVGRATELRLLAEQRGDDELRIPDELTDSDLPRVQEVLAVQRALFVARRQSLRGTLEALDEQAIQLQRQIEGLEEMVRINERHAASLREEAADLRNLFSKGMVNNQRLREVERDLLELSSEIASRRAEIARLGSQVSESRMQREIRVQEFQKEVGEQLRETQAIVTEAEERITALDDQMSRATVKAPVAGIVVERRVHSVGDVLRAGDPLLDIVPVDDRFVVEARVPDRDVNQLYLGQPAEIRFSAFNQRMTNVIAARVVFVSADSQVDEATGVRFYRVRLRVTDDGRQEMTEQMQLLAGMPAEVMIHTGDRTFASYITKPITDMLARAIREE
ncbi:HlyD family type I secretion periplasmic adaptor subunit [Billgrantia diversa]|uniref:HlyD family type I secretion periplasmic adaptor subunit n=1 Tax=Halomonas sp. MCCC 1A13316 TaxID=2733487 RepID=UPI0018A33DC9|nr:HlyD family type I secretion periplasmic adaptor subunit [Halomonas sp. MCCC 1A13316]QOR39732.1 HlyD family type I secretion periplasmic adaptor subunit [Halomonas sp. MCCC 1A13316]